ncbi:MAG: hypothetical protein RLZZ293_1532 [Pseudomonadota bacterium]|jgi:hypothetical protein
MPDGVLPAAATTNATSLAMLALQTAETVKDMATDTMATILNQDTAQNQAQQQVEVAINKKYTEMITTAV